MKELEGKYLPTNDGKTFNNVLTVNGLLKDNNKGTVIISFKRLVNSPKNLGVLVSDIMTI